MFLWGENTFIVPEGQKAFYIDPSVAFGTGTMRQPSLFTRLVTLEQNLNECNLRFRCRMWFRNYCHYRGIARILRRTIDNDLDASKSF